MTPASTGGAAPTYITGPDGIRMMPGVLNNSTAEAIDRLTATIERIAAETSSQLDALIERLQQ